MQIFNTKTCCGRTLITWKLNCKITKDLISSLSDEFKEHVHFTNAGMLYMTNDYFIISAQLNSNSLQINCKRKDYEQQMHNLELKVSEYEGCCIQNNK